MFQQSRGQGDHLSFQIGPKNTNFIEVVKILRPIICAIRVMNQHVHNIITDKSSYLMEFEFIHKTILEYMMYLGTHLN